MVGKRLKSKWDSYMRAPRERSVYRRTDNPSDTESEEEEVGFEVEYDKVSDPKRIHNYILEAARRAPRPDTRKTKERKPIIKELNRYKLHDTRRSRLYPSPY